MEAVRTNGNETLGADENTRCPECDAEDDWQRSRRHRFSPFGAVLLAVLSFWSAVLGWLTGLGYLPALALLGAALLIGIATRRAEICGACGFVRPQRR
jgi:hypothetical protein